MKFKEFVEWCNKRACDGCWSRQTAIICIDIMRDVREKPFWKRESRWQELDREYHIISGIVNPINAKIKEIYGE